jgi:hypothetical protein
MKMEITLKSGTQIEVDVTEFTTGRNGLNELAKLNWTTPENWKRKLHTLEMDQIAAIVVVK